MMNRELTICFDNKSIDIYLLNGFFCSEPVLSDFHNHPFTEIQIVVNGKIHYSNFEQDFEVCSGQMIVFSPNTFHESTYSDPKTSIICFQISMKVEKCSVITLSHEIPTLLLDEIKNYAISGKSVKLPFYLSLIVSELIKEGTDPALTIRNRPFLIHDFFSENFAKNVAISDLASVLCLSEKQTERLIKQYTGNTFRQEITRLRMNAAKHLVATTDLTMTEIAEKVGYQSYSGFWKAYNAFKASSITTNT